MQDFRQLNVWKEAHALTKDIYKLTKRLPKSEQYALNQQLWRAAYSVPANIAEGTARATQKDFKRFLHTALGSISELSYFLLLAKDIGYLGSDEHLILEDKIDKTRRMLISLINKINVPDVQRKTHNVERMAHDGEH